MARAMPGGEEARGERLHVVFVIAGLGAGGAEKVISLISGAWVAQGWRVTILAFDAPEDPIYHRFDPRVEIRRFALSTAGGGLKAMLAQGRRIWTIRRTLKMLRPDAVVSLLTKINVLTLLATLGMRSPVIVSERNNPLAQKASAVWNALLARLYPRARAIVMQTRASMMCLPSMVHDKVRVIANPIAVPVLDAGSSNDALVLTAAGRLTSQKGFDLLIDAFAMIAGRHPQWTLKIWGEGEMRPLLEAQVRSLDLNGRVLLPGTSARPGDWVRDGAIMLLSSRYEGFPNVLGEAMAAGLPVIACDCDFGPREMISHGVDGLLVPPGDVIALAQAMEELIADPQLRASIGERARSSAARFAPHKIIQQWEALITEIAVRRSIAG